MCHKRCVMGPLPRFLFGNIYMKFYHKECVMGPLLGKSTRKFTYNFWRVAKTIYMPIAVRGF